jgi:hypothetical protein
MLARFLAILSGSLIVTLAAIALLPRLGVAKPTAEIAWTASLYERKTRVAEAEPSPRILVVGGSGTLFSFDAEIAQHRVGKPVFNFGTHAGLGLSYILDRAARILRPDDTVLLAPEYELLMPDSSANEYAIQMTAFYDHAYLDHVSWREWPNYLLGYDVLPSVAIGIRTALHHPPAGQTDTTIDELGDLRGNTVARSQGMSLRDAEPSLRPIAPEMISRLRKFAEIAAARKARVFVIPPSVIMTAGYTAPAFRTFQTSLISLYAGLGIEPLGGPDIGFLPPSDMYNSVYHANDRGRILYTDRILRLLCKRMICRQ